MEAAQKSQGFQGTLFDFPERRLRVNYQLLNYSS